VSLGSRQCRESPDRRRCRRSGERLRASVQSGARRDGIAGIYGNPGICGICNLQTPKDTQESESHSLRQTLSFRFNNLQAAQEFPVQRSLAAAFAWADDGGADAELRRSSTVSPPFFRRNSRQHQVLGLRSIRGSSRCLARRKRALRTYERRQITSGAPPSQVQIEFHAASEEFRDAGSRHEPHLARGRSWCRDGRAQTSVLATSRAVRR
jgi:hypothetical protein